MASLLTPAAAVVTMLVVTVVVVAVPVTRHEDRAQWALLGLESRIEPTFDAEFRLRFEVDCAVSA